MACCSGCARWLIGIVSVCVIICAVVAALFVYLHEKGKKWSELVDNNLPFIFILVAMAFAVFSAIIGFLLCCCKKRCLYITYLIIIIIVIIIEVVAIVLAFVYKDNIINGIQDNWEKPDYKESREAVEKIFKCCGFQNYTGGACGYQPEKPEAIPTCYDKINEDINHNMKNLKIAAIVMACVELLLLICAIYLVCSSQPDDGDGIRYMK